MCLTMFDLDGPLALCVENLFFAWANSHPSVTQVWDYEKLVATGDWAAATGMKQGESTKLFQEFMQSDAYPGFLPTPGAIQALKKIPSASRLLATARGRILYKPTRALLDRYFGRFRQYHFNVHDAKVNIAKQSGADFVVDDCYPLIMRIARETSAIPILFPKPTSRRVSRRRGVIILAAESAVYPDMPCHEFQQVCTQAWQEISDRLSKAS